MNQTSPMLFLLLVCLLMPIKGHSEALIRPSLAASTILPVGEAFRLGAYAKDTSTVVFWQIQPGYYLYRDKFSFRAGDQLVTVELPPGETRQDEIFGEVQVLAGLLEVVLPYPLNEIDVAYQGCADKGYCYPPQKISLNSLKKPVNSGKW